MKSRLSMLTQRPGRAERLFLLAAALFLMFAAGYFLGSGGLPTGQTLSVREVSPPNPPSALTQNGESGALPASAAAGDGTSAPQSAGTADGRIDINRAGLEELCELPGVGEATAAAIIAYREEHGPFAGAGDIINVPGIGERKLEAMREYIRAGGD